LLQFPPGVEQSSAELADALGQQSSGFGTLLRLSVENQYLCRRMQAGIAMWSLGAKAAEVASSDDRHDDDLPEAHTTAASAASSIFAYAQMRHAAPFSVHLATDGRLTIERHGRVVIELSDIERKLMLDVARNGVRPK
jgi:hypothetical protein